MPEVTYPEIPSHFQGWDAYLNQIVALLSGPLKVVRYADTDDLPSPISDYISTLVVIGPIGTGQTLYLGINNGSEVKTIPTVAEDPGDSTAVDVAGIVADFNTLLANLRATKVIE